MEFAKYRSESRKLMWSKLKEQLKLSQSEAVRLSSFSPWEVDNICANNWKADNPIEVCADMLFDYIEGYLREQ